MLSKLKQERYRTAEHRFYLFRASVRSGQRWQVHDAEAEPKSLARFRSKADAELFLGAVRHRYVVGKYPDSD